MFSHSFKKTAALKIPGRELARSGMVSKAVEDLSNNAVRRRLQEGSLRYAEIGKAPQVGKSGNHLTPEYMAKTYGIKGYQP